MHSPSMTEPPIACTLSPADFRARRAELAALSLPGRPLAFPASAEPALRDLIAAEAQCCPFLAFDLRPTGPDELQLTITGPAEAGPVIAELFTRP
jgi:hypothetical protein